MVAMSRQIRVLKFLSVCLRFYKVLASIFYEQVKYIFSIVSGFDQLKEFKVVVFLEGIAHARLDVVQIGNELCFFLFTVFGVIKLLFGLIKVFFAKSYVQVIFI